MKKILYFVCIVAFCWWIFDDCSGDSKGDESRTEQTEGSDEEESGSRNFLKLYSFNMPSDVYAFLGNREFNDGKNRLVFSGGTSGRYNGNPFTVSNVSIIGPTTARLQLSFPSFANAANVSLILSEDDALIADPSINMALSLSDGKYNRSH